MNKDLAFLADCLLVETLSKGPSNKIALGQEGIVSSIGGGAIQYIKDQYDPNKPLASFISFVMPGALWKINPIVGILYTVIGALGFNWRNFWSSIGEGIASIFHSDNQVTKPEASQQIRQHVENSFKEHFTGKPNEKKLLDMAEQFKNQDINTVDDMNIVAIVNNLYNKNLIKEADVGRDLKRMLGIGSSSRTFTGRAIGLFTSLITWLLTTSLFSLGLIGGAGAIKGLLNRNNPEKTTTDDDTTPNDFSSQEESGQQPNRNQKSQRSNTNNIYNLQVSPSAPRSLFTLHKNDMSSVWLEKGNIANIDNMMMDWIIKTYNSIGEDEKIISSIRNSSKYQEILDKFRRRNALAATLNVIAFPHPFERKIDIVYAIMNAFLKNQ